LYQQKRKECHTAKSTSVSVDMDDRVDDVYNKICDKYIYCTSRRKIKHHTTTSASVLADTDDDS